MNTTTLAVNEAVTVSRETTVAAVAERMDRTGVGSVLVVDSTDGTEGTGGTEGTELVGIVTDRDLALRAVARRLPHDARIDAVMTCGVVTVAATATLDDVLRTFQAHAVRRLPVVDGDRVVGVVALDDLLVSAARDGELDQLTVLAATVREEVRHPHHEAGLPMRVGDTTVRPPRLNDRQARVGDQLVVHARTGQQRPRDGEVIGVGSPAGDPPFQVRWSDNGHVSFIYPGPDAEIRHLVRSDSGADG